MNNIDLSYPMTYHSLDDMYAEKLRALDGIERTVRSLSAPQLHYRHAPGEWTIAEIVEHLSIVERAQIQGVERLIERAESSGGRNSAPVEVSIDDRFRDSVNGKIKTRLQSEPTGKMPPEDSLQEMRKINDRLISLRNRFEGLDLASARFQHPVLGDLTLGQWFVFFAVHEQRHHKQMTSLISLPGFPRE